MINTILNAILGDFRGLAHDGDINRWHCHAHPALRNSGDTVSGHCQRVADMAGEICCILEIDMSPDLGAACWGHDDPEAVTGDWPATLTRQSRFARWAKAAIEWKVARDLQIGWRLTPQEALVLNLCDTLDAVLWARNALTKEGDSAYFEQHFVDDIAICHARAAKLGPAAQKWLGEMLEK